MPYQWKVAKCDAYSSQIEQQMDVSVYDEVSWSCSPSFDPKCHLVIEKFEINSLSIGVIVLMHLLYHYSIPFSIAGSEKSA